MLTAVLAALRDHAERAAPLEAVGALLGDEEAVRESVPLPNVAADPRRSFEVPARALLEVEQHADARGLKVWGTWHSHVDVPAVPSAADRAFPSPGRLLVIVPVVAGRAGAPRAWRWQEKGGLVEVPVG